MIVVIEGADGSGKTSVAAEIAKTLEAEVLAFPCDEAFTGALIRSYLRKEWQVQPVQKPGVQVTALVTNVDPSALAFQALNVANRMELMPHIRACARAKKNLVIARYWQSAYVYGQLDGLPPEWLVRVHETMIAPDVSLLLDAPAEVCLKRRELRDGPKPPERYEGDLARLTRTVELYRELWSSAGDSPRWRRVHAGAGSTVSTVVGDALIEIAAARDATAAL